MSIGPSPYDELCARVREEIEAEGVVLIVFKGKYGSDVSVQTDLGTLLHIPVLLRYKANEIEEHEAGDKKKH